MVTDHFHETTSHKSCPNSTKIDYWKKLLSSMGYNHTNRLNLSGAEQINSVLRCMDSTVRFVYDTIITPISFKCTCIKLKVDHI